MGRIGWIVAVSIGLSACGASESPPAPLAAERAPATDAPAGATVAASASAAAQATDGPATAAEPATPPAATPTTGAPPEAGPPAMPPATPPSPVVTPPSPVATPESVRGRLLAVTPAGIRTRGEINELTADGAERLLLRAVTGEADCDVELRTIEYRTVGAAGEPTNATASLAIPRGDGPLCSGPRPLLLYAHGTSADRRYSTLTSNEAMGGVLLAVFAARGYLVVSPDYTGYGASQLPYHPYLNAQAQADDMIDALRGARAALAGDARASESQLFLAGYSQGGHVAMATQRLMERDHAAEFRVVATAPMSGPYALEYTLLETLRGRRSDGANALMPLLLDGYQRAYGNLWSTPADVIAPPYDATAPGLFPGLVGRQDAVDRNLLPPNLLAGQGSPYLLRPEAVAAMLADPGHPVRAAFARNSLLDWTPRAPMALCGGNRDPVVTYENTRLAEAAFAKRGVRVVRHDFGDHATIPGGSTGVLYLKFRSLFLFNTNLGNYHVTLAPFCARLARDFFGRVGAS